MPTENHLIPQDERARSPFGDKHVPRFKPYPEASCQICNDNGYTISIGFNCAGRIVEHNYPCFHCHARLKDMSDE